jgi:Protein of unknown function (DUF4054)
VSKAILKQIDSIVNTPSTEEKEESEE